MRKRMDKYRRISHIRVCTLQMSSCILNIKVAPNKVLFVLSHFVFMEFFPYYLNFFSVNPGQVTFDYDIAILELNEEVDLKIYTPACLANKGDNFFGQTATAAGWGYTDKEEKLKPDVPHEAQFPVGECGSGTDLLVCVDIVDGISLARVRIVFYLIVKVLCKL